MASASGAVAAPTARSFGWLATGAPAARRGRAPGWADTRVRADRLRYARRAATAHLCGAGTGGYDSRDAVGRGKAVDRIRGLLNQGPGVLEDGWIGAALPGAVGFATMGCAVASFAPFISIPFYLLVFGLGVLGQSLGLNFGIGIAFGIAAIWVGGFLLSLLGYYSDRRAAAAAETRMRLTDA
jgi:hypothetical protein